MLNHLDLASRFILRPTTAPLPSEPAERRWLEGRTISVEVFRRRTDPDASGEPSCFALHFVGAAGRAELASLPPVPFWRDVRCEWWSMNMPGAGGSPGPATLSRYVRAVRETFAEIRRVAGDRPLFLSGNSLGSVAALLCAAEAPVAGLGLRNPPILPQVVRGRFGWKTLWVGAALVAAQIPRDLDAIRLVPKITAPAVFVSSRRDTIVPPVYQDRLFAAYAGPKRMWKLEGADHADRMSEADAAALAALYREMFPTVNSPHPAGP